MLLAACLLAGVLSGCRGFSAKDWLDGLEQKAEQARQAAEQSRQDREYLKQLEEMNE